MIKQVCRIVIILLLSMWGFTASAASAPQPSSPESREKEAASDTAQGKGIRRIIREKDMNDSDRKILSLAVEAAGECAQALEAAVDQGIRTEAEIFSTLYFPITH